MEFREKPMQNLMRIKEKEICKNVQALLLDGESIVGAYKTVRDQAVFTSHRIFIVDMQGVTGTRQEIFVLPYRKIVHFGIQTAGFGDPLQTSELTVCYADEHEMKFGFIGQEELLAVARAISRCSICTEYQYAALCLIGCFRCCSSFRCCDSSLCHTAFSSLRTLIGCGIRTTACQHCCAHLPAAPE